METIDPAIGGNDTIFGNEGDDLIAGGAFDDTIFGGANDDRILGDNGAFDFTADGVNGTLDSMVTTDPTIGGVDTINGADDEDVIFGGTAGDIISGGNGHDVILGDHGLFDLALPVNANFVSIFITAAAGAGNDTIRGDAGDDFILGQQGGDTIFGGAGQDDITGGHNVLFGVDGDDIIDGGDALEVTPGDGGDVVLGDNGTIKRTFLAGYPSSWQTYLAPFDTLVIRAVVRFDDIDFIAGNDTIFGDADQDILHGQRGNDIIDGGAGDDEVMANPRHRQVSGGADNDIVLGDVGLAYRALNTDGMPRLNANGSWHRDVFPRTWHDH